MGEREEEGGLFKSLRISRCFLGVWKGTPRVKEEQAFLWLSDSDFMLGW